jgi:hypothetical protein
LTGRGDVVVVVLENGQRCCDKPKSALSERGLGSPKTFAFDEVGIVRVSRALSLRGVNGVGCLARQKVVAEMMGKAESVSAARGVRLSDVAKLRSCKQTKRISIKIISRRGPQCNLPDVD